MSVLNLLAEHRDRPWIDGSGRVWEFFYGCPGCEVCDGEADYWSYYIPQPEFSWYGPAYRSDVRVESAGPFTEYVKPEPKLLTIEQVRAIGSSIASRRG